MGAFLWLSWLLRLRGFLRLLLLAGCDERAGENRQENRGAGDADHYAPFVNALDILPRRGQFGAGGGRSSQRRMEIEFRINVHGNLAGLGQQRAQFRRHRAIFLEPGIRARPIASRFLLEQFFRK